MIILESFIPLLTIYLSQLYPILYVYVAFFVLLVCIKIIFTFIFLRGDY